MRDFISNVGVYFLKGIVLFLISGRSGRWFFQSINNLYFIIETRRLRRSSGLGRFGV
jgi:hypothetical protein